MAAYRGRSTWSLCGSCRRGIALTGQTPWASRWAKTRTAGQFQYIIRVGVLGYGLAMFIVTTFFLGGPKLSLVQILGRAGLWVAAGLGFGFAMWWISERRYLKFMKRNAPENDPQPGA